MRAVLALVLVLVGGGACDGASAAACLGQLKPPGEVHGSLGMYLPCQFGPACGSNDPAYRPVPGATLVFTSDECGSRSFKTRTLGDGSYDLSLPEGKYAVAVEGGQPAAVKVTSGRLSTLNLRQDVQPSRKYLPVATG